MMQRLQLFLSWLLYPCFPEFRYTELVKVQDCFQLSQIGLTVVPDFSLPSRAWKDISEKVIVETPNGRKFETIAQFNFTHLNIRDSSTSLDKHWRLFISLPELSRKHLPIRSRILVSAKVRNAIFGE